MTNWTTATCKANGIDIHYQRTGGSKPTVVLLHGLTGNGACWSLLARALENEFDVVMPDARGHGNSSKPPTGYAYEDHARDVVGFLQALGLVAPILLGHSMGGMTAALVASQIGTTIGGVVLADPTFLSPERQREVYESDAAEQHRQFLSLGKEEALARARLRQPHRSPEIVELATEARMKTPLEAFAVLIPPNPDYRRLVRAIKVPSLLIIADKGVVAPETAQALQSLNSRLRVEQIAEAGHGLHYDQSERFAQGVRAFLQSVVAL